MSGTLRGSHLERETLVSLSYRDSSLGLTRCQFITWSLPFSLRGRSLSTPADRPNGDGRKHRGPPDAHSLPREAGGRENRLLGVHVGFPTWGLRLQPAATDRPG